jgi:hypothetical protein
MTKLRVKSQTPDGLISELDLGNFKTSWAGEYPLGRGVAFGGEDGAILLVNKDWEIVGRSKPETDEAINGLAFLSNWIGISTRADVCFVDITPGQDPTAVRVPYGAHGVLVGSDGHFVAPLGTKGLLSFKPMDGDNLPVTISRPQKTELYFYRVITLTGPTGQPVIAAATRRDGIGAMPFDSPERGLHTLTFEALDAIDLCPLAQSTLAVAVLGKDGTIVMCRDVIAETRKRQASVTTRFPDIRGTAYRVLNATGNLVVVTSQAIYCLEQMATTFLQGKIGPVTILEFPIKAIDANIVNEHWLMIVTSRGVLQLNLQRLNWGEKRDKVGERRVTEPTTLSPAWQGREVEQLVGVSA